MEMEFDCEPKDGQPVADFLATMVKTEVPKMLKPLGLVALYAAYQDLDPPRMEPDGLTGDDVQALIDKG
jgi:hypothetical protein